MGQIVKRKKKGRPSKADLARRAGQSVAAAAADDQSDRRRSLRRRNVRYNSFIDYDDYLDEFEEYDDIEDEEEGEEERRREKKVKLVVKLHNQKSSSNKSARGEHARGDGSSSEEEEGEEEEEETERRAVRKKRKISGGDESDEAEYESDQNEEDDDNNNYNDGIIEQEKRKGGGGGGAGGVAKGKQQDSVPGTPSDRPNGLPMPDKKSLELILDKLQKKDTYGVYAEPVDLEELPDYLDVIDHPMDFTTVRKKLANGSYSSFERFESDVFLICSNAMQYNSPETIYYKQARAIQELATKKFQKLRIKIERSEKELKSEQKELKSEQRTKSNFLAKKQMKKPFNRSLQEPVGSDFSAGATLATAGDMQNGSATTQAGACERTSNPADGPVEGNSSLVDGNVEKIEELSSGKGAVSKFGRKSSGLDENRRATYNMSNQPTVRSESIFTTFEGEVKQLVAVGLHAEYSYARSLARFAAALGPSAWKFASQKIEQALPAGYKFGRGWVGEYEPLPTPVLMLEARATKESNFFNRSQITPNERKGDATPRLSGPALGKEPPGRGPTTDGKASVFRPINGPMLEGKPPLLSPGGTKPTTTVNPSYQQQNLPARRVSEHQNKASKLVELNLPPSSCQQDTDTVAKKQLPNNSEMAASKLREMPRTISLVQSVPFKHPNGVVSGGLPNGKVTGSSMNSAIMSSSSDGVPNQMARAAPYFSKGKDQGLTDPVEAMRVSAEREAMRVSAERESIRMAAEKAQKQLKSSKQSAVDTTPVIPSDPSIRNDSNNAAATAARAWMSIGAGGFRPPTENSLSPKSQISAESLYNPARQFHPQIQGQFSLPAGMRFPPENNFPFQAFMGQPIHVGHEGQLQRPIAFPQFAAADLSRFQMQSPWRVPSPHSQQKQKQETLPPDLNIGFQPPGSPVKQSSSVMVDSQQPDLALQL